MKSKSKEERPYHFGRTARGAASGYGLALTALVLLVLAVPAPLMGHTYSAPSGEPPAEAPPAPMAAGGPDEFGYHYMDSNGTSKVRFQWMDIIGRNELGYVGDDTSTEIAMGFNFSFYGEEYSTIHAHSNGILTFQNTTGWSPPSNSPIPSPAWPDSMIAPFHDDLLNITGVSHIWWHVGGRPGERVLVVQWENFTLYHDETARLTFQVLLFQETGSIKFQYLSLEDNYSGASGGSSASVGIENSTGTDGLQYSYEARAVHDRMAVLFFVPPPQEHDMVVESAYLDAPWGVVDQETHVAGEVSNLGLHYEPIVNVSWYLDGELAGMTTGLSFMPDGHANVSFPWTPAAQGQFLVSFHVQPVEGENRTWNNWFNLTVRVYPHDNIMLVDQSHGNHPWRTYGDFFSIFQEAGFIIMTWDEGPLTGADLSNYMVLAIPPTWQVWTYGPEEFDHILHAVNETGLSLMVFGHDAPDWMPDIPPYIQNSTTGPMGIWWEAGGTPGITSNIEAHTITAGVHDLAVPHPNATLAPRFKSPAVLASDTNGDPVAAVAVSGPAEGTVLCVSDEQMLANGTLQTFDNGLFASNMAGFFLGEGSRADLNSPQNLTIIDTQLGNSLWVDWDPPLVGPGDASPDFYYVNRSTSLSGPWTQVRFVDSSVTNITDTGLTDGVQYFYNVTSYNISQGNLSAPAIEGGIPTDQTPPGAVAGFDADQLPGGLMVVQMTWYASADLDLDGYRILRSTEAGGTGSYDTLVDLPAADTSFKDETVEEGAEYFYKIRAFDEVPNYGPNSAFVSVTPVDETVPPIPENVTVADTEEGNELTVSWDINGTWLGDDTDKVFVYRTSNTSRHFAKVKAVDAGDGEWTDTGLKDGRKYYYNLSAVDGALTPNESPQTATVNGTPTDQTPPGAPKNLTLTDTTVGAGPDTVYAFRLRWKAPSAADLDGFRVYRGTTPGFALTTESQIKKTNASTTEYNDTGLKRGRTYYYRVKAFDEVPNLSPPSNEAWESIASLHKPPTPGNLTVAPRDTGNVLDISWDPVSNLDVSVEFYNLYFSDNQSGPYQKVDETFLAAAPDPTRYAHKGLTDGISHWYKVSSLDAAGNESELSGPVEGVPGDIVAPDMPSGLAVSAVPAGNALNISWLENSPIRDVAGYRLLRGATAGGNYTKVDDIPTGTSRYVDSELEDGVVYWYKLRAYDEVPNLSPATEAFSGVPDDTKAPDRVQGLTVIPVPSKVSVELAWTAVGDDDVETYVIYRATGSEDYEILAMVDGNRTTYTDDDVEEDTKYSYYITARDEVPNESPESDHEEVTVPSIDTGEPDDGGFLGGTLAGVPNGIWLAVFIVLIVLIVAMLVLYIARKRREDRMLEEEEGEWDRRDRRGRRRRDGRDRRRDWADGDDDHDRPRGRRRRDDHRERWTEEDDEDGYTRGGRQGRDDDWGDDDWEDEDRYDDGWDREDDRYDERYDDDRYDDDYEGDEEDDWDEHGGESRGVRHGRGDEDWDEEEDDFEEEERRREEEERRRDEDRRGRRDERRDRGGGRRGGGRRSGPRDPYDDGYDPFG